MLARLSLLFEFKASLEWEIQLVPNPASLHSVFEVRFLASFFFLAQVEFRPLMWLVIMHGVVLSRDSQTGGTIRLETALAKVEISDIGCQHALVFLWQKIHIINMVLVYLQWFSEWLPWACSHPLLKMLSCSNVAPHPK